MKALSKYTNTCDRLSMIGLCLFAGECVLGASGRWLSFGPLSIRMILCMVCFFLTLPNVLRNFRRLLQNRFVQFALLFGLYLVVAAIIGWRRGNSLGFIKADITGVLALILLPGFLVTIHSRERLTRLVDIIFYCSFALGIVTVGIHYCGAFLSAQAMNSLSDWLNAHSMGGLAYLSTGMHRIYIRSQIFLQVGIFIGLYKIWNCTGRKRWLTLAAVALITFACLLTYTRGFWLGFALAAILLLILTPTYWKRYLISAALIGALLVGLFTVSWGVYGKPAAALELAGRFNPSLVSGALIPLDPTAPSSPSDATEPTDPANPDANLEALELRQETLREQNRLIAQAPILGNGLGTNLDGIREDGKTEYMYHDMLMKTGIVGFLLFLLVFFLPAGLLIKRHIKGMKDRTVLVWNSLAMHNVILAIAFVSVAITSYTNPFLTNPMGILLVMLLSAATQCEEA